MSTGSSDTRTRILDATRKLLETHGATGTRLADVAREAGVSRQAVYLHFGSRGGLLVALVDHMDRTSGLYERLKTIEKAPDAVSALRLNQSVAARYAPEIHAVAMALGQAAESDPDAAAALQDRLEGRLRNMEAVLQRLADEGRLADGWTVRAATDAVWALGLPSMWQALGVERGWTVDAYERFLVETTERLFVRPA